MGLQQLRNKVEQLKGQAQSIQQSCDEAASRIKALQQRQLFVEQAHTIVQRVAQITQQELEYHVSEVASLALAAVFDEPYTVKLDFALRRNRTEADITFLRDEHRVNPLDASGGGAVDIAAFGLRMALWCLQKNKSRNTFILDEPFKHLKGEEDNQRAIQMVKEISDRLGVQIIMVSDERASRDVIERGADKVFEVTKRSNVSVVKEL